MQHEVIIVGTLGTGCAMCHHLAWCFTICGCSLLWR